MKAKIKVLLILTVACLFLCISCKIKDDYSEIQSLSNIPSNASEFGFVVKEGEWLYHIDESHNNIVRTNEEDVYMYPKTYGKSINIYRNYIYYNDDGIYRVKIDNPDIIEQITFSNASNFIIVNDYIYCSIFDKEDEKYGIYRISLDGKNEKKLVQGWINDIQWVDGWIYYCIPTEGKIMKIRYDGRKKSEIVSDKGIKLSTTQFVINDGWIYFENRNETIKDQNGKSAKFYLSKVRTDGSDFQILVEKNVGWFNVDDNHIYYSLGEGQNLYKINLDGSNKKKLFNGECMWINIIDNYVYFLNDWDTENNTSKLYRIKKDGKECTKISLLN